MDAQQIAHDAAAGLEAAWNAADGTAFGSAFTDDALFITVRGEMHQGREAIASGHQGIFDTIYHGSRVAYRVLAARPVGEDAVLANLRAALSVPAGPMAGESTAIATLVLVDHGQGHQIAALHNTVVAGGA